MNKISAVIFTLLCLFSSLSAQNQAEPKDLHLLLKNYQENHKNPEQTLQSYILQHPRDVLAWQFLQNHAVLNAHTDSLKMFLESLSDTCTCPTCYHWITGNLYHFENNFYSAWQHYSCIDLEKPLHPQIIQDLLTFYNHHKDSLDQHPFYTRLLQIPLARATQFYHTYQYPKCIQTLHRMRSDSSDIFYRNYLLGSASYRFGDYVTADSILNSLLKEALINGRDNQAVQVYTHLGAIDRLRGNFEQALSCYDKSDSLAARYADILPLSLNSGNRGNIYYLTGQWEQAVPCYKKAIHFAKMINAKRLLINWYRTLGMAYLGMENLNKSLRIYRQAEHIAREMNDQVHLINIQIELSDIYNYLNVRNKAHTILKEVIASTGDKPHLRRETAYAKAVLGDLLTKDNRYAEARINYTDYLNILQAENNYLHLSYWTLQVATSYFHEVDDVNAILWLKKAIAYADSAKVESMKANPLLYLSKIYRKNGQIGFAEHAAFQALLIAEENQDTEQTIATYLELARIYQLTSEIRQSVNYLQTAVQTIENIRNTLTMENIRMGYFSNQESVYRELVSCYYQRWKQSYNTTILDSLLYFDHQIRSRVLQEIISDKTQNKSDSLRIKYNILCKQLNVVQKKLRHQHLENKDFRFTELEAVKYELIAEQLRLANIDTLAQNKNSKQLLIKHIQSRLNAKKMGALVYHLSDKTCFCFAFTPDTSMIIPLKIRKELLQSKVDTILTPLQSEFNLSADEIPFHADIAHQLYLALFAPVTKNITLPQRLVIVPDLVISQLPFEMLLTHPPARTSYTPVDTPEYADYFLNRHHAFSYMPSLHLLFGETPEKKYNTPLSVFSNPTSSEFIQEETLPQLAFRSGFSFAPLPFADVEAQQIKTAISQSKIFSGDEATVAQFIESQKKSAILHLATHAFADTNYDAFSGIVFATSKDSTEDGLLMGFELADMDLNNDLITLSACETGRGRVLAGEGLLSLPRIMLGAGASSVLTTLWKVEDRFASELFPLFYRNLIREKMTKDVALQKAKSTLLQSECDETEYTRQHPFFWAPYILYGRANAVSISPPLHKKPMTWICIMGFGFLIFLIIKKRTNSHFA